MNTADTGRLITQAREAKNLSRHGLAKKLNVPVDTVAAWETGKTFPDLMLLDRLAPVLGLRVTELLQGGRFPAGAEAISLASTERDLQDLIVLRRKEEIRKKDFAGSALFFVGLIGLLAILLHSRFRYGYVTKIFGQTVILRWLAWPLTSLPVAAAAIGFAGALFLGLRWMRRVKLLKNPYF